MPLNEKVAISIVSHGQGPLVKALLNDLSACKTPIHVILTLNLLEELSFDASALNFPLEIISNADTKGFAANHNAAFEVSEADYFCVLNPDIRLHADPFPSLMNALHDPAVGVVAPKILNPSGGVEDSARTFPTWPFLIKKMLGLTPDSRPAAGEIMCHPDWVAGMFMVFRSATFRQVCGFDQRYFLYYEDVDLCQRLRKKGYTVRLIPEVSAIHDAQRRSHRNARYMFWHASSLVRFMLSKD